MRLIHQSCSNDIERRDCTSLKKPCHECSHKLKRNTVWNSSFFQRIFALIIAAHFSCIQNWGSHDIYFNAFIKPSKPLFFYYFLGIVTKTPFFRSFISHHSCFQHIKWISCYWCNCSSKSSSHQLTKKASIFFISSCDRFQRLVKSKSKWSIRSFSKNSRSYSFVKSRSTFISKYGFNDTRNSIVLFCLSTRFSSNL